ncbi:hypothetical protein D0T08_21510 [Emticicia sp. C21]|nr:hypothetical protein D0T08_21510 [Emticicia sp. C21]
MQPNSFQLPKVATNPACTVADKGKVVFNTNQNKILYCNGSAWIDPENGTVLRITPAFSVYNYSGQAFTSDYETIKFTSKEFDLNNNFNLDNATVYPNAFVAPDNGVYQIDLNAKLDLSSFSPGASTKIRIGIAKNTGLSGSMTYYQLPINDKSDNDYIHISKMFRLGAGNRIHFFMIIDNAPTFGTLRIDEIYFSGHLVSWY